MKKIKGGDELGKIILLLNRFKNKTSIEKILQWKVKPLYGLLNSIICNKTETNEVFSKRTVEPIRKCKIDKMFYSH